MPNISAALCFLFLELVQLDWLDSNYHRLLYRVRTHGYHWQTIALILQCSELYFVVSSKILRASDRHKLQRKSLQVLDDQSPLVKGLPGEYVSVFSQMDCVQGFLHKPNSDKMPLMQQLFFSP